MGYTFNDCRRLVGKIGCARFRVNIVVDISWLTVGDGLELWDLHTILLLHLVDRDLAVQVGDGNGTGGAATKDIVAFTELSGKLELLSLCIKQL